MTIQPGPLLGSTLATTPAECVKYIRCPAQMKRQTRGCVIDENIESWSAHDWRADPFSRAAYTYVAVAGFSAPGALAKPMRGTFFFAPEATDVEDGYRSGRDGKRTAGGQTVASELDLMREQGFVFVSNPK